jgi:protein tyrosine phosphatase
MQNTIYEFWLMVYQNIVKVATSHNIDNLHTIQQKLVMLTDFIESGRQKCSVYFPYQADDILVFTNSAEHTHLIHENADNIFANVPNDVLNIRCNYFIVKNCGICQKKGYSKRKLQVIYSCQEPSGDNFKTDSFFVHHYWFPDWPDHRSPDDISVLLEMSLDILDDDCSSDFEQEQETANDLSALPIVHCSAGIGRTGCLLAILNGLSQMRLNGGRDTG